MGKSSVIASEAVRVISKAYGNVSHFSSHDDRSIFENVVKVYSFVIS